MSGRVSDKKFYENKFGTDRERILYRATRGKGTGRYLPEDGLTIERCLELLNSGEEHDTIELIRWTLHNPEGTVELVNGGRITWKKLWAQGFRWRIEGDIKEISTESQLRRLIAKNPYEEYTLVLKRARS